MATTGTTCPIPPALASRVPAPTISTKKYGPGGPGSDQKAMASDIASAMATYVTSVRHGEPAATIPTATARSSPTAAKSCGRTGRDQIVAQTAEHVLVVAAGMWTGEV